MSIRDRLAKLEGRGGAGDACPECGHVPGTVQVIEYAAHDAESVKRAPMGGPESLGEADLERLGLADEPRCRTCGALLGGIHIVTTWAKEAAP